MGQGDLSWDDMVIAELVLPSLCTQDDMLLVEMNDPLFTVVSLLAHISRLYPINGLLQKSHVNENEIIETDCLC